MITIGYKTKFDSITRAVAAIGIGLVMIFGNNAPTMVVRIIAVFLILAGVASGVYSAFKVKDRGIYNVLIINAVLDILRSSTSRSAKISSRSMVSISRRGLTLPST